MHTVLCTQALTAEGLAAALAEYLRPHGSAAQVGPVLTTQPYLPQATPNATMHRLTYSLRSANFSAYQSLFGSKKHAHALHSVYQSARSTLVVCKSWRDAKRCFR
jgi:hypothetical protein